MAPGARQEVYIIVKPGSQSTLVQLVGNVENAFNPPNYQIPTKVYYNSITKKYSSEPANDNEQPLEEVWPVVRGEIVNLEAYLFYLLFVYKSLFNEHNRESLKESSVPTTVETLPQLTNIPMIITTHHSITKNQLEHMTQFFMEAIGINSVMFLPSGLASLYGFANNNNSGNGVVIDIGFNKYDLIPVVDFSVLTHLCYTSKIGGQSINEQLLLKLNNEENEKPTNTWENPESVENLKKSDIFEVLPDYDTNELMTKKNNNNTTADLLDGNLQEDEGEDNHDEGVIDIAEIVTSDKDTRKLLEERENMKNLKKNMELDENKFFDFATQKMLTVGRERFSGCGKLIKSISEKLGMVMSQIPDLNKKRALWENIIIVGNTSSIAGFKESLLKKIIKDYLIQEPDSEFKKREEDFYSNATKKKGRYVGHVSTLDYMNQIPISIKTNKVPDYFPLWKKHGYGEIEFLGAQIVAKQVFNHFNDQYFVTREKYNVAGPMSCWNVSM